MALPSTGDTWANVLEPTVNPLNVRKGIITDILIRDYRNADGTVHDLSASAAGLNSNGIFTPFAADSQLRTDLLVTASGANQGFYHIGFLKEDGWTETPSMTADDTDTAQTFYPVRTDVTKLGNELMFTAREWTPLIDMLQMDLPTVNGVPDIGTTNYSVKAPVANALCERQIIALGFDGVQFFSVTLPRVARKKIGKTEASKKNPVDLEMTYSTLICPFAQTPYIISRGGTGWAASGGAPIWSATPPVATAVTGLKATIVSAVPTGADVGTITYTATKTLTGTTTPVTGTAATSGGNVTFTTASSSLVLASAYTFNLIATGDNGAASTSLPSNSITAIT
jgi:hypothetical protein